MRQSGAVMVYFMLQLQWNSTLLEMKRIMLSVTLSIPAVEGTLNLLRSCSKSSTVKRVIFTSSISTLTAKDRAGKWRKVVDETCQTPIDHVWNTKPSGWIYVLCKRLTEEAAFKYAKDSGINLISVVTTTVAGDTKLFSILSAVNARMGSIALVHIEDICDAHIFLMEQARAEGRYICCAHSCEMSQLINHLAEEYPCSNIIQS
ncbi:hypothetical protein OIU77_015357 [Salix suchowensis]|uniref:NAD-dependent epimerase/dehydratase domain-containing protein n=1 Tax=Salix suchowensis TaxID=1278906 RepID=A0ABQ8ZGP7_9ROSI|nr:hypothetical protein OIU77_015357 [Salix suchowensis]